jgi:hypothetical protein
MIKHSRNLALSQSKNYWTVLIIAVSALYSFDAFAVTPVTLECNLPYLEGPFETWPAERPIYVISPAQGWTIRPDSYYHVDKDGEEYIISRDTGVLTIVEHHRQGNLYRRGTCNPVSDE